VPLTTQQQTTLNKKESNKMAQKKVRKIKVRDLKPTKDAKGGGNTKPRGGGTGGR
jgi:hypothetical protein